MQNTGRQAKAARTYLGMSQAALAREAGVTAKTLAGFEAGTTRPHPATHDSIARALETRGVRFIAPGEISRGAGSGIRLIEPMP